MTLIELMHKYGLTNTEGGKISPILSISDMCRISGIPLTSHNRRKFDKPFLYPSEVEKGKVSPPEFSDEEITQLENAFKDLSLKLGSFALNLEKELKN